MDAHALRDHVLAIQASVDVHSQAPTIRPAGQVCPLVQTELLLGAIALSTIAISATTVIKMLIKTHSRNIYEERATHLQVNINFLLPSFKNSDGLISA